MNRRKHGLLSFLFGCFWGFLPLHAVSAQTGVVADWAGYGFSLVRNGQTLPIGIDTPWEGPLPVQDGDLILTEQDSWVEIHLADASLRLMLAENTTICLKSLGPEEKTVELAYGRLRGMVDKSDDPVPMWIEKQGVAAGLFQGDYGFDSYYDTSTPEKEYLDVYCFQGEALVFNAQAEEPVILGAREMVSVRHEFPGKPLGTISELKPEIREFWKDYDFGTLSRAGRRGGSGTEPSLFTDPLNSRQRKLRTGGIAMMATGALAAALGGLIWGIDEKNTKPGIVLTSTGAAITTGGVVFLLSSFFTGKKRAEKE